MGTMIGRSAPREFSLAVISSSDPHEYMARCNILVLSQYDHAVTGAGWAAALFPLSWVLTGTVYARGEYHPQVAHIVYLMGIAMYALRYLHPADGNAPPAGAYQDNPFAWCRSWWATTRGIDSLVVTYWRSPFTDQDFVQDTPYVPDLP